MRAALILALAAAAACSAAAADKSEKLGFPSLGVERTYLLFVPKKVKNPPPLLVLLHGRGGQPDDMLRVWKRLAEREGIVLVSPKSRDVGWRQSQDPPRYFHDLLEDVRGRVEFDRQRVYLFGYSNGAAHALDMGMLDSRTFAAVAAMAGSLDLRQNLIARAERRVPVFLAVGSQDAVTEPRDVKATRDALEQAGFPVEFHEIGRLGHEYFAVTEHVNKMAWEFLKKVRVE